MNLVAERNHGVDDERRNHRNDRRRREDPLVGARRRDVLFQHQLHRVGNRLKDAVRADAHRPEARLRPGNHFALEQHHVRDANQRRVQDDDDFQKRDDEGVDHRSTSPSTTSSDPMSATTSATRWPLAMRRSACRLQNDGGLTRKRYGFVDLPSLTMKYPSSPFGDSIAWYVSPASGLIRRRTLPTMGPSATPCVACRMIRR